MQPLTQKELSDSAPRMGRPALGLKLTTVRLTEAAMARIDALVGTHRRGVFIREAVEAELERRERGSKKAR